MVGCRLWGCGEGWEGRKSSGGLTRCYQGDFRHGNAIISNPGYGWLRTEHTDGESNSIFLQQREA